MKIPILVEINENFHNLQTARFYRECSRCANITGPYTILLIVECAETSLCDICRSTLSTKALRKSA